MTNAFKLISAAALVAATSTAALAQNVPVNSTVSGGQGAEIQLGQDDGTVVITPEAGIAALTVGLALVLGGSSSSTTTTPTN